MINIVDFILNTCNTDRDTVLRCLGKSTFIYYDSEVCLLSDENMIYYFSKRSDVPTKKAYLLAKKYQSVMNGRFFYSKNITMFKNHCILVSNSKTPDGEKYIWTF